MFVASRPFAFFDYFRVPYRVGPLDVPAGLAAVRRTDRDAPLLLWAPADGGLPLREAETRRLGEIPIHCPVVPDEALAARLPSEWRRAEPVVDEGGARLASAWRDGRGGTVLPFDPGDAILACWSERYLRPQRAKQLARRAYYRVRPALPRAAQLAARRVFSRVQGRSSFPRWPVEPALHDLYDLLFALAAEAAGAPVPYLAPWPDGHTWALVLTHDVETAEGCANVPAVRAVEHDAGLVSSWNLVPERYRVSDELLARLRAEGCEIGVHGLRHDGRDLASRRELERRLPGMRAAAERWGASGFRSPATHRVWEWMPELGFDYDSSYPDTDPYEPIAGGCLSWLPFQNDGLVELPITLPQDHTLFAILGHEDEAVWLEKAEALRARGGMALLDTHPDYLHGGALEAYRRFLDAFGRDEHAWRALPRDVSAWWRRRAASSVEQAPDGWCVAGPAAGEARVAFAS